MSSKTKTTTTKEEETPALVPKLRFPEFRGAEGWKEKPLKAAAEINPANGGLPESFVYIDLESVDAGQLKAKERISRVSAPSRAQRLVERGDIIYQVVRPYQRNNLLCDFDDDENYVASTGYAQLRAKGSNRFLYQSIHTDSFVGRVIAKCTGSNYPAINSSDLAEIHLPIPSTVPEQQKIAECLSSVDEVIAAQARKVDALKTHKKGLMQQLFPREGETQPRIRFPEFQNAGEWEVKKLGDFADVAASGDLNSELFSPTKTEICCYPVYSNAVEQEGLYGYYSAPKYPANCVTITARGTLGVAFLRHTKFMGIGRLLVLNFNPGIDSHFMKDCWNHLAKIPQEVTSIPQLTAVTARVTLFPIPSLEEQQRIATCLSSLDALITAETQKLEALKTHKKGLMQQLFPSPEEVET